MSTHEDRDGTAHPTRRERYMLFARGWSAGASAREIAQQDADYLAGWSDGADARKHALADFARRIGYEPTVLRLADGRPCKERLP